MGHKYDPRNKADICVIKMMQTFSMISFFVMVLFLFFDPFIIDKRLTFIFPLWNSIFMMCIDDRKGQRVKEKRKKIDWNNALLCLGCGFPLTNL